jgi:hypothetical protein
MMWILAYFDVDLCAAADVVSDARIALEDAVDHVYVVRTGVRVQAYPIAAKPASFYVWRGILPRQQHIISRW